MGVLPKMSSGFRRGLWATPLTPAMNNSNTIVVPVDSNGNLVLDVNSPLAVGPIVDVRGVILGYYG